MKKIIINCLTGIFILTTLVVAQDEEQKGNIFSVSHYKIKYDMVDEYMDYLKENRKLWDEVTKEKYPDEFARKERTKNAMGMILDHWDDICTEEPSLTK